MADKVFTALVAVVRRHMFVLRWIFAVSVSLTLVSMVQYAVASRELEKSVLGHTTRDFEARIDQLAEELQTVGTPRERSQVLAEAIHDVSTSEDGVLYVGVFDADGIEIVSTDPGLETISASDLRYVIAGQHARAREDSDAAARGKGRRFVFLIPVHSPDGPLVVQIEQSIHIMNLVLSQERRQQLLGLLGSILVAVPLSYLLGGKALRRRDNEARQLAGRDELTGILGRRPFRPLLSAALASTDNESVSLALIDIDHFKGVNDRLGHSYGDRVLVALGQSFEELRASDTAFRLGGDEFAVVLPDAGDREATEVLERVRESFAKRIPGVTISCGVASVRRDERIALQELWERTDSALYQAKRLGRSRIVPFSSLTVGVTVAAAKLDAVHELCDGKIECTAAFQPIWDLSGGCILGHEALLRLPVTVPLNGPAEAFDLADRIGKASELDALARNAVLRAVSAKPWPGGLLFVNVHPAALRDLDFDAFAAEVIAAGLAHTDVVLEVTEQADLDNPTSIRALKRARGTGFKLALDDLGAGNAGLRALTHTQFHVIKVDRQVISRLGIDPAADAVLAAATTFVRNTGGWVIAEGIEDKLQLDTVLEDSMWRSASSPALAGQGFLLGYPASDPRALDAHLDLLEHPVSVSALRTDSGDTPA